MVTIQDVAKHANVGVGTVSRVLSGKGYVKDETRKKIQASIETLNYTPNERARNLFFRKSGIVAVIVPEMAHPFFAQFVSASESVLCEMGYQTMICNTYYEQNYERRYLEMLKQQRVDGIIFGAHTALDVTLYADVDMPIVAMDRNLGEHIPCVSSDHESGGLMAAAEMIRSGCRHVVQLMGVRGEDKVATPSSERHRIFKDVLSGAGIRCSPFYIKWHLSDYSYYQKVADEIFEAYPDVDGIFATDLTIMAVHQWAGARKKRIPEELKLVSYDGTNGVRLIRPRVTIIAQPIERLAREAVKLVVDLIDGKPLKNKKIKLPVFLIPGETTL